MELGGRRLSTPFREVLDISRHCHPCVHGLLPDRTHRRLKAGIGNGPHGNADHRRMLAGLGIDRRSTFGAEESFKPVAFIGWTFKSLRLTNDRQRFGGIIGEYAERRSCAALTGDAVASDNCRGGPGQFYGELAALALCIHDPVLFQVGTSWSCGVQVKCQMITTNSSSRLDIKSGIWQTNEVKTEKIIKVLANRQRLQVLDWLKDPRAHFREQIDGDLVEDGVCGLLIAEKLGLTASTLSEHMRLLVDAGLVTPKKIKQWIFYRRDEEAITGMVAQLSGLLLREPS